jgi:heterogeneous nuclear ribonucleoprotein A1/A3
MLTFAIIIMTHSLNFQELNGRNIRVSYANDRPAGPRSFGGGGGYGGGRGFGGGDGGY